MHPQNPGIHFKRFFYYYRLPKIKEYVDKNDPGAVIIPFSGAFETTLMDMGSDDERKAHMEETKCQRYARIKCLKINFRKSVAQLSDLLHPSKNVFFISHFCVLGNCMNGLLGFTYLPSARIMRFLFLFLLFIFLRLSSPYICDK